MKTLAFATFFSLMLVSCDAAQEDQGLMPLFIQEKKAQLNLIEPASKAGAVIAAGAIAAFNIPKKPITRGISDAGLPLIYIGCGATIMGFLIYHFIGKEMALIMESQTTLKKLSENIETWQQLLPELQQNQDDLSKKVKGALKVLDTITPLIHKLAIQDSSMIQDPRITALQEELNALKNVMLSLNTQQAGQALETLHKASSLSERLFGKKKKCEACHRPFELDYHKAWLYE